MCLSQLWRLPDLGALTFAAFMPRDKKGSFALPAVLRALAMLPLGVLEQGMSLGSWSLAGCCEWSSGWWLWGRCLLDGSCWAGVSA